MRVLRDLLLVKLAPARTRSASGLHLAPALERPVTYGKVMQVGPATREIRVGDVVAFGPEVGDPLDGYFPTPHVLIPERHVDLVIGPTQEQTA